MNDEKVLYISFIRYKMLYQSSTLLKFSYTVFMVYIHIYIYIKHCTKNICQALMEPLHPLHLRSTLTKYLSCVHYCIKVRKIQLKYECYISFSNFYYFLIILLLLILLSLYKVKLIFLYIHYIYILNIFILYTIYAFDLLDYMICI